MVVGMDTADTEVAVLGMVRMATAVMAKAAAAVEVEVGAMPAEDRMPATVIMAMEEEVISMAEAISAEAISGVGTFKSWEVERADGLINHRRPELSLGLP